MILTLVIALSLRPKIGNLASLIFGYFTISAVLVYENPVSRYGEAQFRLDQTSAFALISILLVTFFTFILHKYEHKNSIKVVANFCFLFCVLESFLLVFNGYGILNSNSVDSTMIALMFPIMFQNICKGEYIVVFKIMIMVYTLIAILMTPGSTFYFIFAAYGFAWAIYKKKWEWAAIGLIPILTGVFLLGDNILDSSSRIIAWKYYFTWFFDQSWIVWLFGTGTGTFYGLGPMLSEHYNYGITYVWMHNEYLQILFEQGIIGLILCLILYFKTLYDSRNRPELFLTFCGLGVAMLTQFPLRLFIGQVFFMYLFLSLKVIKNR